MHHCCGSSQGHVMGTCSCSNYSMLFSMPNNNNTNSNNEYYDHDMMYSSFTPSPSSVDCTLSLGTPSTRLTQDDDDNNTKRHRHQRRSGVTNFCWDLLHSNHSQTKSSTRGTNANANNNINNNDPLLARRCANCDTTSTPLWRNGPRGPKSLCNACGIRFKKEERRASAAAAATSAAGMPGGAMDSGLVYGHNNNSSWYGGHSSQSQKMMMGNELRFMEDSEDRDSEENNNGIPFLSWKINVPDRTSLVHDFTR